eukprot:scaffold14901_cov67-Phaeocystis_antarctica.AAC.1
MTRSRVRVRPWRRGVPWDRGGAVPCLKRCAPAAASPVPPQSGRSLRPSGRECPATVGQQQQHRSRHTSAGKRAAMHTAFARWVLSK